MAEAAAENATHSGAQPRRWLRVPSFRVAFALSVFAWLTLIVWVFLDARFPDVLPRNMFAFMDPSVYGWHLPDWDELDWRLPLLGLLAVVGVASSVIVAFRLFVGRADGRKISSLLAATALVAVWLSFFLWFDELGLLGAKYRLARRAPEVVALCEHLRDRWPTGRGVLPGLGRYSVRAEDPDLLVLVPPNVHLLSGHFPVSIRRQPSGIIQIELCPGDESRLEYVPAGSQPAGFSEVIVYGCPPGLKIQRQYHLLGSERVSERLYLVRYNNTDIELNPAAP